MGEKYELRFLSDKSNKNIIFIILETMNIFGWNYNINDYGTYSYWTDGPIWEFGESVEIIENEKNQYSNNTRNNEIINTISNFYSPSITLNKIINNKCSTAIVSIVESTVDIKWKDVLVAFEKNDLVEGYKEIKRLEISKEIRELFISLSKKIKPYYAVSASEIGGLVETPELLVLSEEILGDFNYFVNESISFEKISLFKEKFEIIDFFDVGKFIFTTELIGKMS